jgi:predicted nucleic acid-binding protein
VAKKVLLDTGFLVALVNRRDPDHQRCSEYWKPLRAEVWSVEGILVEASSLLRRSPGGPQRAIALVALAGVKFGAHDAAALRREGELMARYRNVPMDFVDAQLLVTAEEEGIEEILTLDEALALKIRPGQL